MKNSAQCLIFPLHFVLYLGKIDYLWNSVYVGHCTVFLLHTVNFYAHLRKVHCQQLKNASNCRTQLGESLNFAMVREFGDAAEKYSIQNVIYIMHLCASSALQHAVVQEQNNNSSFPSNHPRPFVPNDQQMQSLENHAMPCR